MKRTTTAACIIALYALMACILAAPAHASADPTTLEVKWIEKQVQLTTTSVTSATFDIGGFGAVGGTIYPSTTTGTSNGSDGTTINSQSIVTSTWTNVVAFDYSLITVGSTATLKIAQTVRMPPPRGSVNGSPLAFNSPYPANYYINAPVISTSSAINIPINTQYVHQFRAQVTNPVFILSNLSAAATYFLTVSYGVPIR